MIGECSGQVYAVLEQRIKLLSGGLIEKGAALRHKIIDVQTWMKMKIFIHAAKGGCMWLFPHSEHLAPWHEQLVQRPKQHGVT